MEYLIEEWLTYLSPTQLTVLSLSFGLNSKGITLKKKEIARKLGISDVQIQKHLQAIFHPLSFPTLSPLKEFLLND